MEFSRKEGVLSSSRKGRSTQKGIFMVLIYSVMMLSLLCFYADACITRSHAAEDSLKIYSNIRSYDDHELSMVIREGQCNIFKSFCDSDSEYVKVPIGRELCLRMIGDVKNNGICRVVFPGSY